MILYIILIVLLIIEAVLAKINISYAISVVLFILLLLPGIIKFDIGNINLNVFNLTVSIFFIFSYMSKKEKKNDMANFRHLLILYTVFIAISTLIAQSGSSVHLSFLHNLILFCLEYICIAYALSYTKITNTSIKLFDVTLFIVSVIIIGYGIINYITKFNPYIGYVSLLTDSKDMSNFYQMEERGVLSGRISSTFIHPLQLGQASLLIFAYSFFQFKYSLNKILFYSLNIGLISMCVFCGSRSAIFPIVIILGIYILYSSPSKILKYFLLSIVIAILVYPVLPHEIKTTIEGLVFVWDNKASDKAGINGSSIDGRLLQIKDAFNIVKNDILLGKGEGYVREFGSNHPEMYGYESVLLKCIVDGGIVGLVVFFLFYFKQYKILLSKCISYSDKARVHALCLSFLISIVLTGISYSFFSIYMIFYFMTYYNLKMRIKGKENMKS